MVIIKKKKIMIKLFTFVLFFLFIFTINKVNINGYSETGHNDFKKIITLEGAKLLNEISYQEIEKKMSEINFKLFGWSTRYFCYEEKINFEGDVIFSRSNKTDQTITIDYYLQEKETCETSLNIKGSVSTKVTGDIKKINTEVNVNGDITISKENTEKYESDTKTSFKIVLKPYTKVTLQIKGKGRLTNGVSKYRFLGITFDKGSWERIDVETIYYELVEEECK